MKIFRFLFAFVVVVTTIEQVANAQGSDKLTYDASYWATYHHDTTKVQNVPWITGTLPTSLGGFTFDTRYNFDLPNTVAVFLGQTYGKTVTITPYIGFLAGDFHGITAECNFYTSVNRFSIFGLNQYADMDNMPNFSYFFYDALFQVGKKVQLGIDWQLYHERRGQHLNDIGPVAKIQLGRGLYAKVWWSIDPWHPGIKKSNLGLGISR